MVSARWLWTRGARKAVQAETLAPETGQTNVFAEVLQEPPDGWMWRCALPWHNDIHYLHKRYILAGIVLVTKREHIDSARPVPRALSILWPCGWLFCALRLLRPWV
jgi:hypothetical protein